MSEGVIHDLGYRHHDQPRLGRGHITRALCLESARGAYGLGRSGRSKIMPMILLAAICLPALIIVIASSVAKSDHLQANYTSYPFNVQLLIMIFVAGVSPALVSRDLRFRVVSLYFSRPLLRRDYVLAKYGAMVAAVFLLMALPLTIMFAGALLIKLPLTEQLPDYLRSLAGAALIAVVLAGLGLVIAAITPRRGLGVAAIIAVLTISVGVQSTVQEIASQQRKDTFAGYSGLLSPFTLVDGVQHSLLGADTNVGLADPLSTAGGLLFLAVTVLVVLGCYGALLLRYRRVST